MIPPLLASILLSHTYPIFLFLQLPLISTCHVQLSRFSLYCKFVPLFVSHLSPIFIVSSYHFHVHTIPLFYLYYLLFFFVITVVLWCSFRRNIFDFLYFSFVRIVFFPSVAFSSFLCHFFFILFHFVSLSFVSFELFSNYFSLFIFLLPVSCSLLLSLFLPFFFFFTFSPFCRFTLCSSLFSLLYVSPRLHRFPPSPLSYSPSLPSSCAIDTLPFSFFSRTASLYRYTAMVLSRDSISQYVALQL